MVDRDDYVRRGVVADLGVHLGSEVAVSGYTGVAAVPVDPAPGLVVADVHLGRGGVHATSAWGDLVAAGAVVVLHTSEERPVLLREAVGAGVRGLALKRDGRAGLLGCLDQVAGGRRGCSSDLARSLATDSSSAPHLTPRMVEVLEHLARGRTRRDAASLMGIRPDTLDDYLRVVRARYDACGRHVTNTVSLVREATRDGHLRRPGQVCSPGRDAVAVPTR